MMKWMLLGSIALYLFGGHKRLFFYAALATGLAYLAVRGTALGRLPLVGPHDTLVFFSASLALMSVPFFRSPFCAIHRSFRGVPVSWRPCFPFWRFLSHLLPCPCRRS